MSTDTPKAGEIKWDKNVAVWFAYFAVQPVLILWESFVLATLWGWFIVPMGFDQIGKAHAFGLAVFVAMFRVCPPKPDGDAEAKAARTLWCIFWGTWAPGFALLMGRIALEMMPT